MKTLLKKFWILLVCGKRKTQGNYSVYWGKIDGENYIFKVGAFRSFIVDFLCPWGQWASHPMLELVEKMDNLSNTQFEKEIERLNEDIDNFADDIDIIDQHLSYASTSKGMAEKAKLLAKISKLKRKVEKYNNKIITK